MARSLHLTYKTKLADNPLFSIEVKMPDRLKMGEVVGFMFTKLYRLWTRKPLPENLRLKLYK